MGRYTATILYPWLVVGVFFSTSKIPIEGAEGFVIIPQTLLWVAILWTLLALWGIAAVWLERQQKALVSELAVIPMDSWHYRFNKKMYGDAYWNPPATECHYWALTFNNLMVLIPLEGVIYALVYAIKFLVVWPVGFLIGFVPELSRWERLDDAWWAYTDDYDNRRHQFVGPGLVLVAFVGLLVYMQPIVLLIGIGLALLIAGTITFHKAVFRMFRGLAFVAGFVTRAIFVSGVDSVFAFVLMRRLVCRRVNYV